MAVKKYKKITPLTEEVIVGMIINWRLGADSDSDSDSVDEEPGVIKAEASTKTPLKQNNIAPKEVVNHLIIIRSDAWVVLLPNTIKNGFNFVKSSGQNNFKKYFCITSRFTAGWYSRVRYM
ncbi:hypothetical protein RhiirA4_429644 [Rhizophagus irregularis]|uniref:Uncharacterized protein n=1 Tax=Rhizophagus irregularis TaxID=588596 RepID=A0A2I1HHJ5_9GLOM|nr:hypothetical protein RhiirA4_429644 [Rhizophagus irregularis]